MINKDNSIEIIKNINNEDVVNKFIFKNVKNLSFKIKNKNLVEYNIPLYLKKEKIEKIYQLFEKSLFKKHKEFIAKKPHFFELEKKFYFFGELINFEIENNYFYFLDKKKKLKNNNVKDTIDEIYRKFLREFITKKQIEIESIMNAKTHTIKIKKLSNCWGLNRIDHWISYNLKLCAYKKELIEYVIVHEIAHSSIHGHNKEFWELVAQFEPDWKRKRKNINKHLYEN